MTPPTIRVRIEGEFELNPDQVWPDGVPEQWTVTDVVALMQEQTSGAPDLIVQWNLDPSVTVTVTRTNPHYQGDEVIFPEFAPAPVLVETETVFRGAA